jgi:hypothetical protein
VAVLVVPSSAAIRTLVPTMPTSAHPVRYPVIGTDIDDHGTPFMQTGAEVRRVTPATATCGIRRDSNPRHQAVQPSRGPRDGLSRDVRSWDDADDETGQ